MIDRVTSRSSGPLLDPQAIKHLAYKWDIPLCDSLPKRSLASCPADCDTLYLQPPLEMMENELLQYFHAKACDSSLSAIFLIPEGYCKQFTDALQCLETYPTSAEEWRTPPEIAYKVWYDPVGNPHIADNLYSTLASISPTISPSKDIDRLKLLFKAQTAGIQCIALLDTGASSNFITEKQVHRAGLKISDNTSMVWGAGNNQLITKGTVHFPLRIGSFKAKVQATVVETVIPGVDLVLGQSFQTMTNAIIHCRDGKVSLEYPRGRTCSIHPINHTIDTMCMMMEQTTEYPDSEKSVITAKKAQKLIRKGAPYLLLHVREDPRYAGLAGTEHPLLGVEYPDNRADHPGSPPVDNESCSPTAFREEKGNGSQKGQSHPQPDEYTPPPEFTPMMESHSATFSTPPYGIPIDRKTPRAIPLTDFTRIPFKRNRRFTPEEDRLCREMITDLLDKGLVTPSTSPYGAPLLFIPKKKGGYRVCCDWRELNAITKTIQFPIPRIDETLDQLSGAQFFSTIDLNSGYFQVKLHPEECERTAFSTPYGHYEFKVLGQGLKNAPAIFQSMMTRIFQPYLNKFVVVYLDDILIYSKTEAEHLKHIDMVLTLLKENKLYANKEKCKFFKTEIEFLGNIVGRGTIKMDPAKTKTVAEWPTPATVTELRSFLGLCNHFRKFIKDFATMAAPLYTLTKGKKTAQLKQVWSHPHSLAFQALKDALTSEPVLRHVNIAQPFELVSDASMVGTGAVLLQEGQPVAYTSKKFSPAEKNYTTTEQEMLGVVRALQEWRHYFGCSDLTVVTDHNPLTHFGKGNNHLTGRLARWQQFLTQFNFTWQYRKGCNNVADPISRNPALLCCLFQMMVLNPMLHEPPNPMDSSVLDDIRAAYRAHPIQPHADFTLVDGLKYRHGRLVIPDDPALRQRLISMAHDSPWAAHGGKTKTLHHFKRTFWWDKMEDDVAHFVKTCVSCQRNKHRQGLTPGLLQPTEAAHRAWQYVSMDFIPALPTTKSGLDAILVVVCMLSKMVHLIPTTVEVTAQKLAALYRDNVFKLHGVPEKIISDRGPQFVAVFTKALAEALHIQQGLATAAHPQTDGQSENVVRIVSDALRHYIGPVQDDWDEYLALIEFALNNAYHESIKDTPFRVVYGFHPHTPTSIAAPTNVPVAQRWIQQHTERFQAARKCVQAAKDRQKYYADRHRSPAHFIPGQWVLLSTRNIKFRIGGATKFWPKFIGPFQISSIIKDPHSENLQPDVTAVKLQLPKSCRLHPVFHVSLLKPFHTRPGQIPVCPEYDVDQNGVPLFVPQAIVKEKQSKLGRRMVRFFLIRWQGLSFENDSWIKESELQDISLILKWRQTHPGPVPQVPDNRERHLRPRRTRIQYNEVSQDSPLSPPPPPPRPAANPVGRPPRAPTRQVPRFSASLPPHPPTLPPSFPPHSPSLPPHPPRRAPVFSQQYIVPNADSDDEYASPTGWIGF